MEGKSKTKSKVASWMRDGLIALISQYQRHISPRRMPCCRFTPTCSAYAKTALARHGVIKGLALSLWRFLRCNPLCKGGYDPVPAKQAHR